MNSRSAIIALLLGAILGATATPAFAADPLKELEVTIDVIGPDELSDPRGVNRIKMPAFAPPEPRKGQAADRRDRNPDVEPDFFPEPDPEYTPPEPPKPQLIEPRPRG